MTTTSERGDRLVNLRRVGRIALRDLNSVCQFYGREFMPYPLMIRDQSGCDGHSAADDCVPDRFNHGDLRAFRQWFTTIVSADIRVECNVQYRAADTPSLRILAHRSGESGFLAIQHQGDAAEVFALSSYALGAAVAGSVELTEPGRHSRIVVPEYVPRAPRSTDDNGTAATIFVPIIASAPPTTVPQSKVTVYATVQSHWRSARDWGFDRTKHAVVWVRVGEDGEYIYTPDYQHAIPMAAGDLRDRIDRLIGADVLALKAFRGC